MEITLTRSDAYDLSSKHAFQFTEIMYTKEEKKENRNTQHDARHFTVSWLMKKSRYMTLNVYSTKQNVSIDTKVHSV